MKRWIALSLQDSTPDILSAPTAARGVREAEGL